LVGADFGHLLGDFPVDFRDHLVVHQSSTWAPEFFSAGRWVAANSAMKEPSPD
jgi:hypothetical protein